MGLILPLVIGVLFGCGVFLLMSSSLMRILFGFLLLSQAVNLLIFSVGGLTADLSPLIPEGAETLSPAPDPLPQALLLTAIVIGFALTAFLVVLAQQSSVTLKTDQADEMREAEA